MPVIILCLGFYAMGTLFGAGLFRLRSQRWSDTTFLRDRLNQYRRKLQLEQEVANELRRESERHRIRAEVLEEALESEAETYWLLTGKRADESWMRGVRVDKKVTAKVVEARASEAVIKDQTALAIDKRPENYLDVLRRLGTSGRG